MAMGKHLVAKNAIFHSQCSEFNLISVSGNCNMGTIRLRMWFDE